MTSMDLAVRLCTGITVLAIVGGPAAGQNAVPMLINYQGELRDPATGAPVPDGPYDMLFRIYGVEFGGTPLWQQLHSTSLRNAVGVKGGLFSVLLGSGTGDTLNAAVFSGPDRWLEIKVEAEVLEPRQRIGCVAYSKVSANSRLLDGKGSFAYLTSEGPDSMSAASPQPTLSLSNTDGKAIDALVSSSSTGEWTPVIYGRNEGAGDGVYGWSQNRWGTAGISNGSDPGDAGVYGQNNGAGSGVYGVNNGSGPAITADGDLVVTGAYRGNIGPNKGAPFPRPAYDSGWVRIYNNETKTLQHSLGGNIDNYVVDLTFADDRLRPHHIHYGVDNGLDDEGAYWSALTTQHISVYCGADDFLVYYIRIRIWVYR